MEAKVLEIGKGKQRGLQVSVSTCPSSYKGHLIWGRGHTAPRKAAKERLNLLQSASGHYGIYRRSDDAI